MSRPIDPRRARYMKRFNISSPHPSRHAKILSDRVMDQLDACKTIAARRILLGIGKPRKTAGRKAGQNGRLELLGRNSSALNIGGTT